MRQVIGQHILIGISGHALTNDEKKFIVENNISGVTLFGRNCAEPKQIRDLCAELQSLRHQMADKAPLYIAIDMEGGRVARLKAPLRHNAVKSNALPVFDEQVFVGVVSIGYPDHLGVVWV